MIVIFQQILIKLQRMDDVTPRILHLMIRCNVSSTRHHIRFAVTTVNCSD